MDKLVTVTEMRKIEEQADEKGLSYAKMMENAGLGLAKYIRSKFEPSNILGLIGSGNNGGDALVALAALAKAGWQTKAYLVKPRAEDDPLIKWFLEVGGEIIKVEDDGKYKHLDEWGGKADVLLDGILGTGVKLPLKTDISGVLDHIGKWKKKPYIIAVDCPSGVDCELGAAAPECLAADTTVCMAAVKTGLLRFPAYYLVGSIEIVDIGLTLNVREWKNIKRTVVCKQDVVNALPERPADSHKGTFGTAMIVAGSINYTGAALLAAKAAYRVGVGLVRMAVPGVLHGALAGHIPEATWLLMPHEMGVLSENGSKVLLDNLEKTSAMLLGPGWGMEDTTGDLLRRLLGEEKKKGIGFAPASEKTDMTDRALPALVLDADGLKHLAKITDWHKKLPADSILTPHPGEMSVLTGLEVQDIEAARIEIAEKYAQSWGHVVVLKGALSVISSPDGRTSVIPVANDSLATAGTGDVLAGMVTGFRAQGVPAYEAAYIAAWIHGRAGLRAIDDIGCSASVLAGDVLLAVPPVLKEILHP